MMDDHNDKEEAAPKAKPVAGAMLETADRPDKPSIEKLKLVTTEEARLAAEIEKLRGG